MGVGGVDRCVWGGGTRARGLGELWALPCIWRGEASGEFGHLSWGRAGTGGPRTKRKGRTFFIIIVIFILCTLFMLVLEVLSYVDCNDKREDLYLYYLYLFIVESILLSFMWV